MKIVFASDFDNTLYFKDNSPCISQQDIDAVNSFRKSGGLFGISTGRPIGTLKPLIQNVAICDFFILSNGAEIKDGSGNSLKSVFADKDDIRIMIEKYASQSKMSALVAADQAFEFFPQTATFTPFFKAHLSYSWEQLPLDKISGYSFYTHGEEDAERICKEINEMHLPGIIAFYNKFVVDVGPSQCNKGKALQFVKHYFSADKIAAMGDSFNDTPMLKAADISFTFPESPEETRSAASFTVQSVSEAISTFRHICSTSHLD